MDRREMLRVFGAGTAGLVALEGSEALAGATPSTHLHIDPAHAECFNACTDCAKSCEILFHHCFKPTAQGHQEHAKAARFALDCAEFCGLSTRLIARMSPLMGISCMACADACKKCGDECSKSDMPEMKECAEFCRKCEQSCREMARSMQA